MTLSISPGNQASLQSFTDYLADTVFIVSYSSGDTFIISYATHSFLRTINKTFEEVIDVEIAQIFPKDEAAVLRANMINSVVHGTENNFKYVSAITGKNTCLSVQIFPVIYNGRTEQLACILKDITGIDCAEENTVNNKLLMQRIYDFFPEGIVVSDEKGYIIECNSTSQQLFDISREKTPSISIHEKLQDTDLFTPEYKLLPPEEFPSAIALTQKKVVKNVTLGIKKRNEEVRWLNISSAYLNLPGYGVVTSYTDITQRIKEQEQTNTLKKTLDAIINCSSDCIIFLDTSFKIALCNQQAHRFANDFLGRDIREGEHLADLLSSLSKEEVKEYLQRAEKKEEIISEEKIRFINGDEKWYCIKFYPAYNERGEYIGCVINFTDITARKENELKLQQQHEELKLKEAAIRKAQNQFETVINSSSDFIFLFDTEMNVVLFNEEVRKRAIQLLGEKGYGELTIHDLPKENQNNVRRGIQGVKATGKPVFFESRLTFTPENTMLLYSKYFPVFDDAGNYAGCTLIVTDITSFKQKELQFATQNKQLKELLDLQERQKEEIRETKNILQAAINSSSDIIAFLDTNHNKVFCNLATEQFAMKYWNRSIKVGDNLFDFLPKKLHRTFRRSLGKTETNKVLNLEKMFRLADSTYAWFSIRFFPTSDEKGNYIGSFINISDITQRKNFELRLRRQNEELRIKSNEIKEIKSQLESLINSSSDYIILLDTEMKVILYNTTANEASLNYLKKPYSKGISLIDFLPIENRENTTQYIQQVKETGRPVFIETRFVLREESKRWLYAKFFPVYSEAGRYDGCAVISTDITTIKEKEFQIEQQNDLLKELIEVQEKQNDQLKANELEIMETKNQLEAIINSSSDNILFVDTNNKVIFFNKAASNHFLKLNNELLKHGENILHYIPKEKHETFKQSLVKMQGKKTFELEEEIIYPDGDKVWFYRKYYPIYNQKSEYIGYVLNSVNINRRKLFELKLSNQNEQLREIARMQSHELRRPLANILGLIYLLTEEHVDFAERTIFLSKLKYSAEELDDVIKKITNKTVS